MTELIDRLLAEGTLSAAGAARALTATLRAGRPVHPGTIARWISRGVLLRSGDRLKLEGFRAGRKWLTSRPAITRFLAAQQTTTDADLPVVRSPAERERAGAVVNKKLVDLGAI